MPATPPSSEREHLPGTMTTAGFYHREVQNLAWCLTSPSIIADAEEHEIYTLAPSKQLRQFLEGLDHDPSDLIDWLGAAPSPRLGLIFERYWQYYWTRHTEDGLWSFNRQLHQRGRTLGELDALHWSPSTLTLDHYELAVKFYLQLPQAAIKSDQISASPPQEPDQWVGPNVIDWLHKKHHQMCDRQLRCVTPDTVDDWTPWSIAHTSPRLRTRMIFKGRLFYQLNADRPPLLDGYINCKHDHGYWLTITQWQRLYEGGHWLLLNKDEWLAPLWGKSAERTLTHRQMSKALTEHLDKHDTPVQIISLCTHSDHWSEAERLFVVPQGWPNRTS